MVKLIQEYFVSSVKKFPEKIAVNYNWDNLTYKELDAYSNKLANLLVNLGVKRNNRIAFCLHKSIDSVKSVLGILKAGGCYVPLDSMSPPERLSHIVEDCLPSVIICKENTLELVSSLLVKLDEENFSPKIIVLSSNKEREKKDNFYFEEDILNQTSLSPVFKNIGSDLAYILYTSGSTGKPKGVMITHSNIVSFIEWSVNRFSIVEEDILSNHAPMHFDLSTFDLYCTFKVGATLVLVPPELNLFPEKMVRFIEEKELTIWLSVPSILSYLAKMDVLKAGRMPKLRMIFSTGEVFPTPYLVQWMNLFPEKKFVNMFGPTETTVECTYYIIDKIPTDLNKNIPIGSACEHLDVFALKENGSLAGIGELGELCVRGPSVSRGYWNNPQKTEQAFVKNPLFPFLNDQIYKTGDLVELREDGNYDLKGRKDRQIKFMGYRIELDEIESALYSLDYVKEATVIFNRINDLERIVAFISLKENNKEVTQIKDDLKDKIPKYMVPRTIIVKKDLPRTSSGKVDRVKIKTMVV